MVTRTPEDSPPSAAFRPDVPAPPEAQLEARPTRAVPSSSPISGSWRRRCATGVEIRSIAITGLFVLAVLYTLYFARAFLLPIVLAVLLDFLLSPVIRALKRLASPSRSARRWSSSGCSARSAVAPTAWPIRRASGSRQAPQSLAKVQEPAA